MKKRLFAILTALTLCLTMLPTTALAAESYGFFINGTSVTRDNINSLPGVTPTDSSKQSVIHYYSHDKLLILCNVTISANSNVATVLNCSNSVERIILRGENVIDGTEISRTNSDVAGIFTTGPLQIEGDDYGNNKLTITMPRIYTKQNVCGISADSAPIMIRSCSLDVLCGGAAYVGTTNPATNAIYAHKSNITIQNASIRAVIGKDRNDDITDMHGGSAIYTYKGTLSITNSDVTAGAFSNSAIQNSQHKFTALEGTSVVLTGCALDLKAQATGQDVPARAIHTWNWVAPSP